MLSEPLATTREAAGFVRKRIVSTGAILSIEGAYGRAQPTSRLDCDDALEPEREQKEVMASARIPKGGLLIQTRRRH